MLWLVPALVGIALLAAYLSYRFVFCVPTRREGDPLPLPKGEQYERFRTEIEAMVSRTLSVPYEETRITARDGTALFARYYPSAKHNGTVQLLFHGYKSMAELDFCGGLRFAREQGSDVLLVDQRAHGRSGGKCLTFGLKESQDCLDWANYAVERFGSDCRIVLYGVSMGAATVLLSAGLPLPPNVKGIVADSAYTSPRAILRQVMGDIHLPVAPTYALVRMGARIFGGFDPNSGSVTDAMARCTLPVLIVHGTDDRFVPCAMGQADFDACASSVKKLLLVPGAGHGLSYMVDPAAYRQALNAFLEQIL